MKFALDIPIVGEYSNPRNLADLAAEAEQAGWDGFFIWDIFFSEEAFGKTEGRSIGCADPSIALAAIATRTSHIKFGAFMTPLARHHPWKVAREAVSLDHLSNGRLIFGAGLGMDTDPYWTTFGGQADARIRAEMLDEGLQILSGLWTGERFHFNGRHYQIKDAILLPKPIQSPRIPVWLAGGWPRRKPFQRAARWDGIYLMTLNQDTQTLLSPAEVQAIAAYVKSQRQSLLPFDIAVNVELPSDHSKAIEMIVPYAEAGATWIVDYEGSRDSFEKYRQHIRNGPPKLS